MKWNVKDIELWLSFIGLSNLYPKFRELSIDGSCINSLTEEDIRDELSVQSGIIIKKIMSWVNKGLKEYAAFVEVKENSGMAELREITQKARPNDPFIPAADIKGTFKQPGSKNGPLISAPLPMNNLREL